MTLESIYLGSAESGYRCGETFVVNSDPKWFQLSAVTIFDLWISSNSNALPQKTHPKTIGGRTQFRGSRRQADPSGIPDGAGYFKLKLAIGQKK